MIKTKRLTFNIAFYIFVKQINFNALEVESKNLNRILCVY